jgi:cell division protein FtsQ
MAREQAKSGRGWRRWLIAAGGVALFASTAAAAWQVRRFVLTDAQFRLPLENREALQVEGLRYASLARVLRVFEVDLGRSVFAVPLEERRRRLTAIDWVEEATVSRIWPNRLVVRIAERKPAAFVNLPLATGTTKVLLIDEAGVLLEQPPRARFTFPVLSGITESQSEYERQRRVRAMVRLLNELGPAARDVSEVNAADLENLRITTPVEGRAVELQMGDGNYGRRFQGFMEHYPEIRKRSETTASFDLRLDDRITARN